MKPTTDYAHQRKCHDCGNVAEHEDSITPWVLCKACGSQDTRRVEAAEATADELPACLLSAPADVVTAVLAVANSIAKTIEDVLREEYRADMTNPAWRDFAMGACEIAAQRFAKGGTQ